MKRIIILLMSLLLMFSACLKENVSEDQEEAQLLNTVEEAEDIISKDVETDKKSILEPEVSAAPAPTSNDEGKFSPKEEQVGSVVLRSSPFKDQQNILDKIVLDQFIPDALSQPFGHEGDMTYWIHVKSADDIEGWIEFTDSFKDLTGLPVYDVLLNGEMEKDPYSYYGLKTDMDVLQWFHDSVIKKYSINMKDDEDFLSEAMTFKKTLEYSHHDLEKENPYFSVNVRWPEAELTGFMWEDGDSGKEPYRIYPETITLYFIAEEKAPLNISSTTTSEELKGLFGKPYSVDEHKEGTLYVWFMERQGVSIVVDFEGFVSQVNVMNFWD